MAYVDPRRVEIYHRHIRCRRPAIYSLEHVRSRALIFQIQAWTRVLSIVRSFLITMTTDGLWQVNKYWRLQSRISHKDISRYHHLPTSRPGLARWGLPVCTATDHVTMRPLYAIPSQVQKRHGPPWLHYRHRPAISPTNSVYSVKTTTDIDTCAELAQTLGGLTDFRTIYLVSWVMCHVQRARYLYPDVIYLCLAANNGNCRHEVITKKANLR